MQPHTCTDSRSVLCTSSQPPSPPTSPVRPNVNVALCVSACNENPRRLHRITSGAHCAHPHTTTQKTTRQKIERRQRCIQHDRCCHCCRREIQTKNHRKITTLRHTNDVARGRLASVRVDVCLQKPEPQRPQHHGIGAARRPERPERQRLYNSANIDI